MNSFVWRAFGCSLLTLALSTAAAQQVPAVGAQVWIEPGQTPEEIDGWFRQLENSGMSVARLFLMWSYIERHPGQWDFSLYDTAFEAARRHHIRIVATLTPTGPPTFNGGDGNQGVGVIVSERQRLASAEYIARVVQHYRADTTLDTWLFLNEPGQLPVSTPDTDRAFGRWLAARYPTPDAMNEAWGTNFKSFETVAAPATVKGWNHNAELDWRAFWIDYQTGELRWLAAQVRKSDPGHFLHLNPAGLTNNLAERSDDLPAWRNFLDSLGCSIHPAWHFSLVSPEDAELLVSYTNDLVRGSIEPKPYWVTELQGGNNIYSGSQPIEPTADETAQWLWTSIGAGADRILFWLLNARRAGVESGEWSLLDFQQQPGRNLRAAAKVAAVLKAHAAFFAEAKPVVSPVTVIVSLQTMTFEETYHHSDNPARDTNAQFFESLGFYQALSLLGLPPRLKHFDDYDWRARSPQHRVAIVPDARVITPAQVADLREFVVNGNTLLLSGLSGFYGPHAEALPLTGFELGLVTGGDLKEVHLPAEAASIALDGGILLPSEMWQSGILPRTSSAIAHDGAEVTATERRLPGGGRVLWIPSPVGTGAWFRDPVPLSKYLSTSVLAGITPPPFALREENASCVLRVLQNGARFVTVMANGSSEAATCRLIAPTKLKPAKLWEGTPGPSAEAEGPLPAHGTVVTEWVPST